MVLYPNKLPESERVCFGICTGMDIQPIMMLLKIQKQRKKNTQCEKKSSTPNLPKTIKV